MNNRRNENSKNIRGVLPMSEARIRIQNMVFEFCFKTCFRREYITFTDDDKTKFKSEYSYFLENSDPIKFEIEFASFHFYKWVRRLGMKYSKEEVKSFLLKRMFNPE
jgi:hypothetical protein